MSPQPWEGDCLRSCTQEWKKPSEKYQVHWQTREGAPSRGPSRKRTWQRGWGMVGVTVVAHGLRLKAGGLEAGVPSR